MLKTRIESTWIDKIDYSIKSQFIEMFGDRYNNDKHWKVELLKNCTKFYNGKAHEQVVDDAGEYILIISKCISTNFINYRRTNSLLFPLEKNDIVMVMSDVPNGKAFAKCALIEKNNLYTLNQRICCLRNYDFNSIFFKELLNRHEYFMRFDDGQNQTNLRKNDLLECPIICPPNELQNKFADFVQQIDKSKFTITAIFSFLLIYSKLYNFMYLIYNKQDKSIYDSSYMNTVNSIIYKF